MHVWINIHGRSGRAERLTAQDARSAGSHSSLCHTLKLNLMIFDTQKQNSKQDLSHRSLSHQVLIAAVMQSLRPTSLILNSAGRANEFVLRRCRILDRDWSVCVG